MPKFVTVAPGWQAWIHPQTSRHGPIDVLFVEVDSEESEEFLWGVDTAGQLTREVAGNAQMRKLDPRVADGATGSERGAGETADATQPQVRRGAAA